MALKPVMGVSTILATASQNEFRFGEHGTSSFLPTKSPTISEANVDLLALLHSAEHLAVALL